jgi:HEAT repeat protein
MVPARRLMSDTEAHAMQNTVHLMTVLQASGVPAQREWAAAKLRVCDPQMHPYVVEALVTAARSDAAPMVRATAIQSLAQMKANTPPVLVTLESARQDRDPRVRDEAIQAVRLLTGDDATSVQPAVYRVER